MGPVRPHLVARLAGGVAGLVGVAAAPAVAAAHGLSPVYQSPLPLAVYLVGAATTVALSFVFVLVRDMRAAPLPAGRLVRVARLVRWPLRAIGLLGWAWIMLQGMAGGSSDAAVASLFLWVYGWVGVAMISALLAPIWEWLNPFATIHDILAWGIRRMGIAGWAPGELPSALRVWPAVAGFAFFIWLELVAVPGNGTLTVVLAAYTALTLALMAQFGRDAWLANGETFTVWFRTLNRLAPYGVADETATRPAAATHDAVDPDVVDPTVVVRRPFASGLLASSWTSPRIVLVAIGTASIIFDGLSQTVAFAALFGAPALGQKTLLLLLFLGLVACAALAVARLVSPNAIGAGLLPIAVGYLVAHYLTYLLIDGQRIVIAVSDPLQRGDDLFGTAFFQPNAALLAAGLVWTIQLAAVVGGHMMGAWSGHVTATRDQEAAIKARQRRDMRHRKLSAEQAVRPRNVRAREIPLALVMVVLTTLTLWSLGQSIVQEKAPEGARQGITVPA